MRIGELATATGLRNYGKRGLPLSRQAANGYHDYPPEAMQWLYYLRAGLARELERPGFGCPMLAPTYS